MKYLVRCEGGSLVDVETRARRLGGGSRWWGINFWQHKRFSNDAGRGHRNESREIKREGKARSSVRQSEIKCEGKARSFVRSGLIEEDSVSWR